MRPDWHHLMCSRYLIYYFSIEMVTESTFAKLTTAGCIDIKSFLFFPERHLNALKHLKMIP